MRAQKGFTLLELLLVIAIIGTLSVLIPIFGASFTIQNSISNAQNELIGSLRKAQIYSMMGKQNSSWSAHWGSGVITLFKGSVFNDHDASFDETFSYNNALSITGANDITFTRPQGTATASGITIAENNQTRQITISSEGVVNRQ